PARPGAALDLLAAAAEAGAIIVAVGPWTNLALLEAAPPGLLGRAAVVLMGGHVPEARPGFPPVGPEDDFNVQQDHLAARIVLEACDPLVVPLAATNQVHLRAATCPGCGRPGRWGRCWPTRPRPTPATRARQSWAGPGRGCPTTCSTSSTTRWPAPSPWAGTA
ncbi:MAG TPA: nucleoside hydrolase, partial [Actinomycetes bacterium]|nr:nucleoside hydrolase [Actinomycetes bacterium]